MSSRRIDALVLGANGPIGRAIARRSSLRGLDVLLTSRRSSTFPLDATDTVRLNEVLRTHDVRVVVDLSNPEVPGPVSTPSAVLDSLAGGSVARIVFASSAAVYGDKGARPFSEADALLGTSAYAVSKLRAEHDLNVRAPQSGITTAVLRIFNVYGPGCVKSLANRLVDGPRPELAMSDRFVRDFVHVDDVADAVLAAVMSEASGVFNVATGVGTTNLDLARAAGRDSYKPGPEIVSYSVGNPSVIHERLGWTPGRYVLPDIASRVL